MGSVCALHISPKTWNNTMNNGIKTKYQQIVDAYSEKIPKFKYDILKLGTLNKRTDEALSKVYEDYIIPIEEQFVAHLTNQGTNYQPLGNIAVYDIVEGNLNKKPLEHILNYPDKEHASWSCFRLGNDDIEMYVISTIPLLMYVHPTLTTAFIGDKGWGVLESLRVKYKQPALPTGNWLANLQKILDPTDLAPLFGIISHDQLSKWISYFDGYVVKHSDSYKRKGIGNVQVKLSDKLHEKYITTIKPKKRRTRKRKQPEIAVGQRKLFDF